MKFNLKNLFVFKKSKVSVMFIVGLIVLLGLSGFFISRQYIKANSDYVCSSTESVTGECAIDYWDPPFYNAASSTPSVSVWDQIGHGRKAATTTTKFNSLRTLCPAGTTGVVDGSSDAGSHTYNEEVTVAYAACDAILSTSTKIEGPHGCKITSCPSGKNFNISACSCDDPTPTPYCLNDLSTLNATDAAVVKSIISKADAKAKGYLRNDANWICEKLSTIVDQCETMTSTAGTVTNPETQPTVPYGYLQRTMNGKKDCYIPTTVAGDTPVGFQCSVNGTGPWTNCGPTPAKPIILPSRNSTICLRSDSDLKTTTGKTWSIMGNSNLPLASDKYKGLFVSNNATEIQKVDIPCIKTTFGAGNVFKMGVNFGYTGTKDGLGVDIKGIEDKILNIRIASGDDFIEF